MEPSNAALAHTVRTACKRIGVGRTSMYALFTSGEITPIRVRGRVLIPETELQRLVAQRLAAAKEIGNASAS